MKNCRFFIKNELCVTSLCPPTVKKLNLRCQCKFGDHLRWLRQSSHSNFEVHRQKTKNSIFWCSCPCSENLLRDSLFHRFFQKNHFFFKFEREIHMRSRSRFPQSIWKKLENWKSWISTSDFEHYSIAWPVHCFTYMYICARRTLHVRYSHTYIHVCRMSQLLLFSIMYI